MSSDDAPASTSWFATHKELPSGVANHTSSQLVTVIGKLLYAQSQKWLTSNSASWEDPGVMYRIRQSTGLLCLHSLLDLIQDCHSSDAVEDFQLQSDAVGAAKMGDIVNSKELFDAFLAFGDAAVNGRDTEADWQKLVTNLEEACKADHPTHLAVYEDPATRAARVRDEEIASQIATLTARCEDAWLKIHLVSQHGSVPQQSMQACMASLEQIHSALAAIRSDEEAEYWDKVESISELDTSYDTEVYPEVNRAFRSTNHPAPPLVVGKVPSCPSCDQYTSWQAQAQAQATSTEDAA